MFSELSKRIRSSLSIRLALFFSATFSVCIILAFTFVFFRISFSLEKASHEVISAKWREVEAVYTNKGQGGLKEFLSVNENRVRNAPFLIRLVNRDGETLFIKTSVQDGTFDFDQATKRLVKPEKIRGWFMINAIGDEDRFEILTEPLINDLFLQVGRSSEDREDIIEGIEFAFATTAAILILLSSAIGIWFAKRTLKPIRDLSRTIELIASGDFKQRVPVSETQNELKNLGEVFNKMISRIERLILGMKESLDNLAHDIRTPLSRSRLKLEEAIVSQDLDLKNRALGESAENISEISALVSQLMDISEAEAGSLKLNLQDVDLTSICKEVADVYDLVADEKQIQLLIEVPNAIVWKLDRRRFKQVIANLVDNAIKFSPTGSLVKILAQANTSELTISVADAGEGISDEDLPKIWDRLYRGDKSRSTSGMGLGLALVRSIVLAHGGDVTCMPNKPQGSIFRIVLPLQRFSI